MPLGHFAARCGGPGRDTARPLDQSREERESRPDYRLRIASAGVRAAARRFIVQSIAFAYAAGREPHPETDPLNLADPVRAVTVKGAVDMEQQVLSASGLDAIVLRYGLLYGPGTWREASSGPKPALHVDAAAHAALLAITRGAAGVYNIAVDDGAVSIAKARTELGFDPRFRGP